MDLHLSSLPSKLWRTDAARRRGLCLVLSLMVSLAGTSKAFGDVSLLVEEPYGFFGSVNPTGHSAIYLNRVFTPSR
jgi:hypothetical protein